MNSVLDEVSKDEYIEDLDGSGEINPLGLSVEEFLIAKTMADRFPQQFNNYIMLDPNPKNVIPMFREFLDYNEISYKESV